MAEIQGKAWGQTRVVEQRNGVAVHYIEVECYGYCSWHRHSSKYNRFVCLNGRLKIEREKNDYGLTDVVVLEAGESTTVPPGEYHRFIALTDCEALEVYWTELTEDIERRSCGGKNIAEDNHGKKDSGGNQRFALGSPCGLDSPQ